MARNNEVGSHKTTVAPVNSVYGSLQGFMAVTYHSTRVVMWNHEQIILNSGGWHSATTKLRMNQASNQYGLGFQVYQEKHLWWVKFGGKKHAFYDGITLLTNGEVAAVAPLKRLF
jgi:hypothetical protein